MTLHPALALLVLLSAGLPAAAGGRTFTVNDAGADCASTADFTTIQAAVDAAPAAHVTRIHVCPGTYAEHVLVQGFARLTLEGEPGARIVPPPVLGSDSIVRAIDSGKVAVRGFSIDGDGRFTGSGIYAYGIYVADTSAIIENNEVVGIRPEPFAASFTHAIGAVDNDPLDTDRVVLKIRDNVLEGYGQMGIDISAAASVRIERNTFTGRGPTDLESQVGVILREVPRGRVSGNHFSGHWFTPFRAAVGLYLEESSRVRVDRNDFTDDYEAIKIYGAAFRNRATRNAVFGAAFGLTVDGAGAERNVLSGNTVNGAGGTGVTAVTISGATDTTVTGNAMAGFAGFFDDVAVMTRYAGNTCDGNACP
jgi:nitrous oxidase accessory protein NosD